MLGQTVQTRLGVRNTVRTVARYCSPPKLLQWEAAFSILQYIQSTSASGTTFQRGTGGGIDFDLYVDSDFASKTTNHKSVSGAVVRSASACGVPLTRATECYSFIDAGRAYGAMASGCREPTFLRYM